MLERIRRVLVDTRDAFLAELRRREPADQVADLLTAMRREVVDARTTLKQLEARISELGAGLGREQTALADCQRRRGQAERIGDGETARVAAEFAARHAAALFRLQGALSEAESERDRVRSEVDEMTRRYRAADRDRHALVARLKVTTAQEAIEEHRRFLDELEKRLRRE
ncbi:MAG: hypothetical protein ACREKN_06035 [Longimicrobiaceae bacterium]